MTNRPLERELQAVVGRVTPQRRVIANILQEQERHLSAEEIFVLARRQHPGLSLATVYRTLRLLADLGLVRELRLNGDRYRYEVEQGQAHQHMVCLSCGKVIEFTCSHYTNVHRGLADQHGFQITNARVKLMGYCADCRARAQKLKGDI